MCSGPRATVLSLSLVLLLLFFIPLPLAAEDYTSDQFLSESLEDLDEDPDPAADLGSDDYEVTTANDGMYWFLLKLVGGLGVVILTIWGIGKLLQKSGIGNNSNQFMRVHSTLPLSRDQFLRITQIGKKFIVIGVTGESINKICEITDPDVIQELNFQSEEAEEEPEQDFSNLLKRFLGGADHSFRQQQENQNIDTLKQKLQELQGQGEVGG